MSATFVSCFYLFVLGYTIVPNPVSATKSCQCPAIFNFGDSNSDTGGYAAAFRWFKPPQGETFFHMPAGRASDGRLIIDFIATSFGLPLLSAYLNSLGTNFSHGANFAFAGATVTRTKIVPFNLDEQHQQFTQFMNRSQLIKKTGEIYSSLMPEEEYFGKALYTFDMGQNDLTYSFFANLSPEQVMNTSIPYIVSNFFTIIKNNYEMGARSFWIHNTGPIGCLPYVLRKFRTAQVDNAGCVKSYNEVARYFNYRLKEAIIQLRKDFPLAAITYVDVYSVKYSLFTEPQKYGFEHPLVVCCGHGGKNNFDLDGCGDVVSVNGSTIYIGPCERPSVRVIWDGIHYTEAANKFVFDKISSGEYSDPPIPLRTACCKLN